MGAECLWGVGGKDPAPLTLSLWNSLTQELWKLNVATLVGMQMAADVNAHGDKGSVLRAHSSGKGPPKAPHSSLGVCLHVSTAASAHDLQPKSPAHSPLLVLTMEKGLPFSPDSPMA